MEIKMSMNEIMTTINAASEFSDDKANFMKESLDELSDDSLDAMNKVQTLYHIEKSGEEFFLDIEEEQYKKLIGLLMGPMKTIYKIVEREKTTKSSLRNYLTKRAIALLEEIDLERFDKELTEAFMMPQYKEDSEESTENCLNDAIVEDYLNKVAKRFWAEYPDRPDLFYSKERYDYPLPLDAYNEFMRINENYANKVLAGKITNGDGKVINASTLKYVDNFALID